MMRDTSLTYTFKLTHSINSALSLLSSCTMRAFASFSSFLIVLYAFLAS